VSTIAPDTIDEKLTAAQIVTIIVLLASAFIALVSELAMGVALPTIMAELDVSASTGQWLTTGYALTLAVIIPATGYILRRFRLRPVFAVSMGLFSLGTIVAMIAPGFEVLLTGRIIQALGTGVLVPLLITTTFSMVAPSRRGRMMAMVTAVTSVAPALAPAFSGLVMAQLSWRWLFIIVLPIALVALVIGALKIPNPPAATGSRFDVLSFALSAVGFGALVYGLSAVGEGAGEGIPALFWVAVPLGLVSIAAFVLRQVRLQRTGAPLLDMRIFTRRAFTTSIIQFGFLVVGAFSTSVLLPLVLQESLGLGVLETGLFMAPGGATIVIVSIIVGRFYPRVGARTLMVAGAVVVAAGWWALTAFDETTPVGAVLATYLVICAGQALAWVPIFTLSLGSLPDELHAHGSAALNTVQQLFGAAGLAVLVGVFTINTPGRDPAAIAAGGQAAFAAGGIVALVVIVAALFAPSRARQAQAEAASNGAPTFVEH